MSWEKVIVVSRQKSHVLCQLKRAMCCINGKGLCIVSCKIGWVSWGKALVLCQSKKVMCCITGKGPCIMLRGRTVLCHEKKVVLCQWEMNMCCVRKRVMYCVMGQWWCVVSWLKGYFISATSHQLSWLECHACWVCAFKCLFYEWWLEIKGVESQHSLCSLMCKKAL